MFALFSECDKLTNWSESTSQLKLTCCWFLRRDTYRCYFSFSTVCHLHRCRSLTFQEPQKTRQTPRAFHWSPWRSSWLILANFPTSICCAFFEALTPLKNKSSWLVFGFATWSQVEQEVHPPISDGNQWEVMAFFGTISFSLYVYWCSLLTELQGFSGQCRWHRGFVGLPSRFSPGDLGSIFWLGMLSVKTSCIAKLIVTKLTKPILRCKQYINLVSFGNKAKMTRVPTFDQNPKWGYRALMLSVTTRIYVKVINERLVDTTNKRWLKDKLAVPWRWDLIQDKGLSWWLGHSWEKPT